MVAIEDATHMVNATPLAAFLRLMLSNHSRTQHKAASPPQPQGHRQRLLPIPRRSTVLSMVTSTSLAPALNTHVPQSHRVICPGLSRWHCLAVPH